MEKILNKINDLNETCRQVFGQTFKVEVVWNKRLKVTAGKAVAHPEKLVIELNPTLYKENEDKFIEDTVPHEFAHIVAYVLYKTMAHDANWYHVVNTLQINTERCHSYDVSAHRAAKTKSYKYSCGCKEWDVTPQRKSWMNRGKVYFCPACKGTLVEV